jgi:hypothetical protein
MAQLGKVGDDTTQTPGDTPDRIDVKLSGFVPIEAYLKQL